MITLELQNVPSELRPMFEGRERLDVPLRTDGKARDAALLWLWSKEGDAAWVSHRPKNAQLRLNKLLEMYPRLARTTGRIRWLKPSETVFGEYDYAVVEQEADDVVWTGFTVRKEQRTLVVTREATVSMPDFEQYSLDELLDMLDAARRGESVGYDEPCLVEEVTTRSLYRFVLEYWSTVVPETFVNNWHVKYLCDEMQRVLERTFEDKPKECNLVINISPGESKSSIASVFLNAWAWKRMPTARFIGGSYKHKLAADLSRKTRDVVMSRKYQQMSPMSLREDQNAKDYFVNDRGGMRLAIGTGGVAGFHGHVICIDDPLDPNKAASEAELKSANEWICQSLEQRKIDQSKTPTILIMQRLHQNDPTAAMLKRAMLEGGAAVKYVCLPAELSDDVQPPELREFYEDGLMDPKRLPRKVLNEKRAQGRFFFSGQYMQRPTPLEGAMFKWERIKIDQPPLFAKEWKRVVRYWDKAGTQDAGCRTAGVKMGEDYKGRIWVLNVTKGQWDSDRREAIIVGVAVSDGTGVRVGVEQEPGSGGKDSAVATAKNLKGFSVTLDRPTGDKSLRADPFSVQVNVGNVYLAEGPWNADYLEELQYFPNSEYKDQVDASSGAFKMLTSYQPRVGKL